jgi:hypothetical protein
VNNFFVLQLHTHTHTHTHQQHHTFKRTEYNASYIVHHITSYHIMSTSTQPSYYSHPEPLLDVTYTFDATDSLLADDDDDVKTKKYCWLCNRRQAIACSICITIGAIIAVILFLVTWFVIVPYVVQKQVCSIHNTSQT